MKPLSEFWKQESGPLGYTSRCKACINQYRAANAEKLAGIFSAYYQANKDRIRIRAKEYRKATAARDKVKKLTAAYKADKARWDRADYQRHASGRRAATRLYALLHPDESRGWKRNYKAKKHSAFVEHVDESIVYERDMGLCQVCGLPVEIGEFHLDHRIALSRGGEHSYANCQTAHDICNIRKSSKLPDDCAHLWRRS